MAQRRQHLKRRSDGRYACRYRDQWFYGDTELEALEARELYKKRVKEIPVSKITVGQYAAQWLNLYKHDVSDKCFNDYAKQLDVLVAVIGSKTFDAVTVDDAARVYLHYEGYSQSTIKRSRMLFISLFETAIENDMCRKNPFKSKSAQPPRGTEGSHRALTAEEDQLILSVPADFRLPVLVMRYAGLRRGEMLALDIDRDVDFEKGTIRVRQAVRYDSNQPIIATPKTKAGDRTVPLFDILRHELEGHHGLVARSAAGTMMSEAAFSSAWARYINQMETAINGCHKRWYGKKKEHAGVDLPPWKEFNVRPHDLRHSYATMIRDAGVDMSVAIAWMGHADEKMILKVYDHITESRLQDGIQRVENTVRSQNGCQNLKKIV